MNLTTLLGLGKPLVGELYDVEVQNTNMNKIDAAIVADRARMDAGVNLGGTWTDWDSDITSTITEPSIASNVCKWRKLGNNVAAIQMQITLNSPGAGVFSFSLPFTVSDNGMDQTILAGFYDASAAKHYVGRGLINPDGTKITRAYFEGSSGPFGNGTPVATQASDIIYFSGVLDIQ